MDAHYQFFSGGASTSSSHMFSSASDALTWIVKADIIFGRFRLVEPQLSKEAASVKGDPTAFANMCGPEFVGQETRGARALVMFSATNLTTESKQISVR